jgi:hypothetical protein
MKKIYSILFCLMAMSITFSSCSKGGDDDFLPNGGGTEVNGIVKYEDLTEDEKKNLPCEEYSAQEFATICGISANISDLRSKYCKVTELYLDDDGVTTHPKKYDITDDIKNNWYSLRKNGNVFGRETVIRILRDSRYIWVALDSPYKGESYIVRALNYNRGDVILGFNDKHDKDDPFRFENVEWTDVTEGQYVEYVKCESYDNKGGLKVYEIYSSKKDVQNPDDTETEYVVIMSGLSGSRETARIFVRLPIEDV